MTVTIVAKNSSQKIAGSTVGAEGIVLQVAGIVAHTCPTGMVQRVHCIFMIEAWNAGTNLRPRVAGVKIAEWNNVDNLAGTTFNAGEFILTSAQQVTVTTKNMTTEGGEVIVLVSVLQETPA